MQDEIYMSRRLCAWPFKRLLEDSRAHEGI
jgi:hypothetical protein